jgi:RNA polymerase sigma-70 factor (ECF subfamily)
MQAVALGLLGYGPDAEDAVQDAMLERRAQRDWMWHALGELSEPLRSVTLLRYFSDVSSYEQIATLCGVPVGTVRSRLNQGRSKLATALRATAELAHDDVAVLTEARRREAEETLAAERGEFESGTVRLVAGSGGNHAAQAARR